MKTAEDVYNDSDCVDDNCEWGSHTQLCGIHSVRQGQRDALEAAAVISERCRYEDSAEIPKLIRALIPK